MLPNVKIRPAEPGDFPAMASIRAGEWQSDAFWLDRIGGYLAGVHSPQHALAPRAAWVALRGDSVAGFVAGHLTRRFDCDGELQWINVAAGYRGKGIADQLLAVMLDWFRQHNAARVCVNVEPGSEIARRFYARHGAVPMGPHWMLWRNLPQMPVLFGP